MSFPFCLVRNEEAYVHEEERPEDEPSDQKLRLDEMLVLKFGKPFVNHAVKLKNRLKKQMLDT